MKPTMPTSPMPPIRPVKGYGRMSVVNTVLLSTGKGDRATKREDGGHIQ